MERRQVPKVFCVGANKTGTTSLEFLFRQLGYRMGDVAATAILIDDWANRRFDRIIKLCKDADAFQDLPFSLPFTYQAMDMAFPGSKFILTVRGTADQWYRSLTRFSTELIGKDRLPTAEDLKTSPVMGEGFLWRVHHLAYGVDESAPYDPDRMIRYYESHNAQVSEYFRYRADDFLRLNLADATAMDQLCAFLGVDPQGMTMPHVDSGTIVESMRHGRDPSMPDPL